MARVKICGINDAPAFDAAAEAGADWIGFVFFPASPRFVTPAAAAALSARHTGGPQRVGLFVGATDTDIAAVLDALPLDALQLYDTPTRIAEIAQRFGLPVWHAVPFDPSTDLPTEAGAADAILIEPRAPAGATRPGGNAVIFDWSRMRGWKPPFPWLLAGGLTPTNVADAIKASGARAVDVSSGVETAPGRKSPALIAAFVRAANAIEQRSASF